ncbi:hypothetical protein [Prauserella cavernicola]|uniref:DUF732 domain-containing protein n=1 Tax=Prauserella cavernicola TaxID=2800127 RepID=A0A934QZ85_9PSEU|nr:hypothetical protein [Prauserella cavernicola]MBK1789318.1 hypothetical protein [Prauserella cavernicola]
MTEPQPPFQPSAQPQQPQQPQQPFQPQYQPQAPAPKSRRGPVLLGLVAGLVVGGGGVGLGWLFSSSSGDEGAQADAAAACDILDRTPEVDLDADLSGFFRLSAASALAAAAAEVDGAYEPVNGALREVGQYVQRRMDTESDDFVAALDAARAACSEL